MFEMTEYGLKELQCQERKCPYFKNKNNKLICTREKGCNRKNDPIEQYDHKFKQGSEDYLNWALKERQKNVSKN